MSTTTKEEYKAKWKNEMNESKGPCKVFSFGSRDFANPACIEALTEMGVFGKRPATARDEVKPPAKKPRELEPEHVLREKFDNDVEKLVKTYFQPMKAVAKTVTITDARRKLEKLPEKERIGLIKCSYGDGQGKLSKILRSKEHKHREHASDVLEMLRASKKQFGSILDKNNDFAPKIRALWRDIPQLSEIAETPELFICTAMQPDVTKARGLAMANGTLTPEGACNQASMIYLCNNFGVSEERASLALFLNAIQIMLGYRVEGSVPHLTRFMLGGDLPPDDVFFKIPEYNVAWEANQRTRQQAVTITAVVIAQRIGFTALKNLDSFDQMTQHMEDLLKRNKYTMLY